MTEISSCMLFLVIIVAGTFVSTISANYCNLKTCLEKDEKHTMCLYASSKPAEQCGKWRDQGLSPAEKKAVLEVHNALRQKVAAGEEKRGNPGPQPAAVHMPNLVWDDELEKIAQRWANQCNFNHDGCRDVERFVVGQNIAVTGTSNENHSTVQKLCQLWSDEVTLFNRAYVSHLPNNINDVGHYTQMVYATTTHIGCGRIFYTRGGFEYHYLVCNYGPAGNYRGKPIYLTKT